MTAKKKRKAAKLDFQQLAELCTQDRHTEALLAAHAAKDADGVFLVSAYENPGDLSRIAHMLTIPRLCKPAVNLVLDGIHQDDDGALTTLAYEAIKAHADDLRLSSEQAASLLSRMADSDDPIEDTGELLNWVFIHHPSVALVAARERVAAAQPGSHNTIEVVRALELLGASSDSSNRAEVHDLANRCLDASQPESAGETIQHLQSCTEDDVAAILTQLSRYSAEGWKVHEGYLRVVDGLSDVHVLEFRAAVPDGMTEVWFEAHILPRLFAVHPDVIVRSLDGELWTDQAVTTVLALPSWGDIDAQLVVRAFKAVRNRGSQDLMSRARTTVKDLVVAADPGDHTAAHFPRLGVRVLLQDALSGRSPPENPELAQALGHLHPDDRRSEFMRARWTSPTRAGLLAEIVSGTNPAEVSSLLEEVKDLSDPARCAFLTISGPALSQEQASEIAAYFAGDQVALETMARSEPTASVLLDSWTEDANLCSFRALIAAEDQRPIQHAMIHVRDYTLPFSAAVRSEMLEVISEHQDPVPLALEIVSDWSREHPPPDDGTLIAAMALLARNLTNSAAHGQVAETLASICRTHGSWKVREAAYEVLSNADPVDEVVDLLHERSKNEASAGQEAVEAAIATVAQKLVTGAQADDPAAAGALASLQKLSPQTALPAARRIASSAVDPEHRLLAVGILSNHGNREADVELLRTLADEYADPGVRAEAQRGIRRLEIGDLHAAHERIGELADCESEAWNQLDPAVVFGSWAQAVQAALERIAENEASQNWGQAIDQLTELAKVTLYRAIEVAGSTNSFSEKVIAATSKPSSSFGSTLRNQQVMTAWPWVAHFGSLYGLRTEHVTEGNTTAPPKKRDADDFTHALRLFRDGAHSCLTLIVDHTP